jgi:hypothetical protein
MDLWHDVSGDPAAPLPALTAADCTLSPTSGEILRAAPIFIDTLSAPPYPSQQVATPVRLTARQAGLDASTRSICPTGRGRSAGGIVPGRSCPLDGALTGFDLQVPATRGQEIAGEVSVVTMLQPTFSIDYIQVIMNLC